MAESLDDKLARAFASIEVRIDAIDQKLTRQHQMLEGLIISLHELDVRMKKQATAEPRS